MKLTTPIQPRIMGAARYPLDNTDLHGYIKTIFDQDATKIWLVCFWCLSVFIRVNPWQKVLIVLLLLFGTSTAHAHKPSDSYLSLQVADHNLTGQWDIALRDLDFAIGLDGNGDGDITWGELRVRHAAIAAYALPRLKISAGEKICALAATEHLVDNHSDGAYAVLRFSGQCAATPMVLDIAYSLFFDVDPQHKGLLRLAYQRDTEMSTTTAIFSADKAAQRLELADAQTAASGLRQFLDYLVEGIWHIWIGFDHILFLLSLLLPAVLIRQYKRWQAVADFRGAFWEVFKIVTAFTVAHSITLSLATLGVVSLPTRWVESAIAASVVLAALNNIFPVWDALQHKRWLMAFVFGLIHGFGFASVLADLGLPQGALLLALVGFNAGVEVGQLAIVGVFLPVAYFLRHTVFYRQGVLVGGSGLIALLAAVWLVERVFEIKLIGL